VDIKQPYKPTLLPPLTETRFPATPFVW